MKQACVFHLDKSPRRARSFRHKVSWLPNRIGNLLLKTHLKLALPFWELQNFVKSLLTRPLNSALRSRPTKNDNALVLSLDAPYTVALSHRVTLK